MGILLQTVYFRLLCLSLNAGIDANRARAEELICNNKINWDDLYRAAEIHAVRPQIFGLLQLLSPGLVPQVMLARLGVAVKENQFKQLSHLAEYFSIKEMLDEAGIRAIPFKGFALEAFYNDLSERESADVDLFIYAGDLEKIRHLMFSRGYKAEAPLGELTDEYILGKLCEYNFDKYEGSTRTFHFEMHWRPGMTSLGMNIILSDLETHIRPVQIQNRPVEIFSPTAQLLLLIMHHGGKDQFLQLKQILDISRIISEDAEIDWHWVGAMADKYHLQKLLYIGLNMASLLTGVPIPCAVRIKANCKDIQIMATKRICRLEGRRRNNTTGALFQDFTFNLRARTNNKLRLRMIGTVVRSTLIPKLIPAKFHHYFFNKKIRQEVI